MRSLASRIANFFLEARRRLPAAIPAAPAPMIKTSKSGSRRRPASAGHETAETRPPMALRRVSLRVFSAGAIDRPNETREPVGPTAPKSSMARRVRVADTTYDCRIVFHAHGVMNFFKRFHRFLGSINLCRKIDSLVFHVRYSGDVALYGLGHGLQYFRRLGHVGQYNVAKRLLD